MIRDRPDLPPRPRRHRSPPHRGGRTLAVARYPQTATGTSSKKTIRTATPPQQITVRITGHEHLAEDAPTPVASKTLHALQTPSQQHTPMA